MERPKAKQPNSFSQPSGTKETSYTNQHVATESQQEHKISKCEKNPVTTNSESYTDTSRNKSQRTYSQTLQECTVPMHSSTNVPASIIPHDPNPSEVTNICSQSYMERKLVDIPKNIPDESTGTNLQKEPNFYLHSQSLTNLENSEVIVHQAIQDQIYLPQSFDGTTSSTTAKPLPISTSTSVAHSPVSQNSPIEAATETCVPSISATHHHLQHVTSHSDVMPSSDHETL